MIPCFKQDCGEAQGTCGACSEIFEVYTDASLPPHGKRGGVGIVVIEPSGNVLTYAQAIDVSRPCSLRAELMAFYLGLTQIKHKVRVKAYTDCLGIVEIAHGLQLWKEAEQGQETPALTNRAKRRLEDRFARDADVWSGILQEASQRQVSLNWIKGHGKNVYNATADRLAAQAVPSRRRASH